MRVLFKNGMYPALQGMNMILYIRCNITFNISTFMKKIHLNIYIYIYIYIYFTHQSFVFERYKSNDQFIYISTMPSIRVWLKIETYLVLQGMNTILLIRCNMTCNTGTNILLVIQDQTKIFNQIKHFLHWWGLQYGEGYMMDGADCITNESIYIIKPTILMWTGLI